MEPRIETQLGGILCSAFESSDNGFAVLDAEDCFVYCNPTYIQMFGLQEQAVMGHRFREVLDVLSDRIPRDPWPEPQHGWLDRLLRQHRAGACQSFEIDTVDGRHLLVSEMVCPTGEVTQHSRDITSMREVEQHLHDAQEALKRMASDDELTGLPNRGYVVQMLDRDLARVARCGHPLSLAVLSIDYFKQILEKHGREAGDQVLLHLARLLQASLRKTDLVGRMGDAEFAVLLPETQSCDALTILRRLCNRVLAMHLPEIAKDFSYSFSGGVVTTEARYPVSSDWMLASADKAVMQARASGCGCVVPYSY